MKIYSSLELYYLDLRSDLHARSKLDIDKTISRYFPEVICNDFQTQFGTANHRVYLMRIVEIEKLNKLWQDLNTIYPRFKKNYYDYN